MEKIIGDRVVEAVSQSGGYSPGTADRVRTTSGRRAFVKAASPAQNPDTPAMHRAEARITRRQARWLIMRLLSRQAGRGDNNLMINVAKG
ncbi:hypothetical protein Vlu01_18210 [Micromonospora lutea]|uniref:Uncharacterized protein n=1 Tax=Micromonospora lutea TaxID=419825 RepID=A0ABQ4ITJ0_9ACTN|nr:hypothetical protein Vlu01_18210 [Micromonospora lutea]